MICRKSFKNTGSVGGACIWTAGGCWWHRLQATSTEAVTFPASATPTHQTRWTLSTDQASLPGKLLHLKHTLIFRIRGSPSRAHSSREILASKLRGKSLNFQPEKEAFLNMTQSTQSSQDGETICKQASQLKYKKAFAEWNPRPCFTIEHCPNHTAPSICAWAHVGA